MKKIINGKKYDTDTAREMAYWDNGAGVHDFNLVEKTLYRKKTGEFFLYIYGGPDTEYAKEDPAGYSWTGGERIEPLSFEAGMKFAEENMDVDEYEKEFGEVSEGGEEKPVQARISPALYSKLKAKMATEHRKQSDIISAALKEYLD